MALVSLLQALRPSRTRTIEVPATMENSGPRAFVPLQASETPTSQYFQEEALYVHDLLEMASNTPSLTEALPHLQEGQKLIDQSKQKGIYDPVVVQRVLATYVLGRVDRRTPGLNPLSLEDTVRGVIFSMQEQVNGLMESVTVEKLAISMYYGDIMRRLATIVTENRNNIMNLKIPELMKDYTQVRESYLKYALDDIPTVDFEQDGKKMWRSTDRVVYRGAVRYYHTKLQEILNADPLMVDPTKMQEQVDMYLGLIIDFAQLWDEFPIGKCEYTREEREELIAEDNRIINLLPRKIQQIQDARLAIETQHDELYDALTAAQTLEDSRTIFDQLFQCSFKYSQVLDISSLDGIIDSGSRKLVEFGATIA